MPQDAVDDALVGVMVETIFIPASLEVRMGFATINGARTLSASLLSPPWKAGTVLRGARLRSALLQSFFPSFNFFRASIPPRLLGSNSIER